MRTYQLYQPQVTHYPIHEARLAPGHYAYNHMASVEWFNGRFYAVWGAHAKTHLEGQAGQVIVLSTSEDFIHWTPPVEFVGEGSVHPVVSPDGVQWQPNLLNYYNKELWCLWCVANAGPKNAPCKTSGTWFSRLSAEPGARWVNRRILNRHVIEGKRTLGFPSQNPFLCRSGRVISPATFIYDGRRKGDQTRRWNACLYSDDGETWQVSNPISQVDDAAAQWEPFFHEQADGRLRHFMRNMTKATPHCTQWQLTCTGTGSRKGQPVVFDPDPRFSRIETANTRVQVLRQPDGRYCMIHHDEFVQHRDYHTRVNVALFFSRSGADDFVAAVPVSRRNIVSTYPQGVWHDGRIYVAYTIGRGEECRGIEGAIIDPAPEGKTWYIWPRLRDNVQMQVVTDADGKRSVHRSNPDSVPTPVEPVRRDGRRCLLFRRGASAGVDTDAVDLDSKHTLTLRFEAKVLKLQERGNLVLCSLGDRIPIRLGVPANRPGRLYAYAWDEWRPVGDFPAGKWHRVTVTFGRNTFRVGIGGRKAQVFRNPLVAPNPRLYLGDGYVVDYVPSNQGSEFLIDLESIGTRVD